MATVPQQICLTTILFLYKNSRRSHSNFAGLSNFFRSPTGTYLLLRYRLEQQTYSEYIPLIYKQPNEKQYTDPVSLSASGNSRQ